MTKLNGSAFPWEMFSLCSLCARLALCLQIFLKNDLALSNACCDLVVNCAVFKVSFLGFLPAAEFFDGE